MTICQHENVIGVKIRINYRRYTRIVRNWIGEKCPHESVEFVIIARITTERGVSLYLTIWNFYFMGIYYSRTRTLYTISLKLFVNFVSKTSAKKIFRFSPFPYRKEHPMPVKCVANRVFSYFHVILVLRAHPYNVAIIEPIRKEIFCIHFGKSFDALIFLFFHCRRRGNWNVLFSLI